MRVTDDEGNPLASVYLGLSEVEAWELADSLLDLLRKFRSAEPGWHVHVNDATYEREITVYREDDDAVVDIDKPS